MLNPSLPVIVCSVNECVCCESFTSLAFVFFFNFYTNIVTSAKHESYEIGVVHLSAVLHSKSGV